MNRITTKDDIIQAMRACGITAGDVILVHCALSKLGFVVGGAQTVCAALLEAVGPSGTVVVPTHTANNTDPANWEHPPVPEAWWPVIRQETPAFDPAVTPTRMMGAVPELFRTLPDAKRSTHPIGSFAAIGPDAEMLTIDVPFAPEFGDGSTVARLYDIDADIVLIGVDYDRNTSLHLAEHRADFKKSFVKEGSAMFVDGKREWVAYDMMALETDDFVEIGKAFENEDSVQKSESLPIRSMKSRELVDFATDWMTQNRAS